MKSAIQPNPAFTELAETLASRHDISKINETMLEIPVLLHGLFKTRPDQEEPAAFTFWEEFSKALYHLGHGSMEIATERFTTLYEYLGEADGDRSIKAIITAISAEIMDNLLEYDQVQNMANVISALNEYNIVANRLGIDKLTLKTE